MKLCNSNFVRHLSFNFTLDKLEVFLFLKSYVTVYCARSQGMELARKMDEGVVGKPRRDPATGWLADQRLPHTDIGFVKARILVLVHNALSANAGASVSNSNTQRSLTIAIVCMCRTAAPAVGESATDRPAVPHRRAAAAGLLRHRRRGPVGVGRADAAPQRALCGMRSRNSPRRQTQLRLFEPHVVRSALTGVHCRVAVPNANPNRLCAECLVIRVFALDMNLCTLADIGAASPLHLCRCPPMATQTATEIRTCSER